MLFPKRLALFPRRSKPHRPVGPLGVERLEDRTVPTMFNVLNTNDSGAGSLRDALTQANADTSSGTDIIQFEIPGSGVQTIHLADASGALPTITRPVFIDGSTANGFAGTPLIVIDGSNLTADDGLTIDAANCTVSSLDVVGFANGTGIVIGAFGSTGVTGNLVTGCYVGVGADGSTIDGNDLGILIDNGAASNTIGGLSAAARNVISGNIQFGVELSTATANNVVAGNYIGVDATGLAAAPNGRIGVVIGNGANHNTIGGATPGARNVISANIDNEILIDGSAGGATANVVEGNFIGPDITGLATPTGFNDKPDAGAVVITNGAESNQIGGSSPNAGNYISGNGSAGVTLSGNGTSQNLVAGNFIGVDFTGAAALGNAGDGVIIIDGAQNNSIGLATDGAGNIIGGNIGDGVLISGAASTGNILSGNKIGTDVTEVHNLGNAGAGVSIQFAPNNLIGGTAPNAGNTIAFNQGAGVTVGDSSGGFATGNSILGNFIFSNGGLGIDSSPNTLGDVPTLATAFSTTVTVATGVTENGSTLISGSLTAAPDSVYRIEFFDTTSTDRSAAGFLGFTSATTNDAGFVSFQFEAQSEFQALPRGDSISATATGPDGTTSRFAQDIQITTPGTLEFTGDSNNSTPSTGGTVTYQVNRFLGSDGTVTVDFATTAVSAVAGVDFVPTTGTLTFGPGETSKTFTVTTLDNLSATAERTLNVVLSKPTGGAVLEDGSVAFSVLTIEAPPESQTPSARYVASTYTIVLGRAADAGGVAFWAGLVDQGVSRITVAAGIENSVESRTRLVETLYEAYLGRTADNQGLQNGVAFLLAGGTIEQLKASIFSSQEYFLTRGGGTNDGFLVALYRDVLGRAIDPASQLAFGQALAQGGSRFSLALFVLTSPEGDNILILALYRVYLNRLADPSGALFFVNQLQAGTRDEAVIADLIGSDEFFSKV